jgi:tetratricopeptide (TPR) repeat protein
LLEDAMRRTTLGAIFILTFSFATEAQAQRRAGEANPNYWSGQGAGFSPLQWFMMSNTVPSAGPAAVTPNGAGAKVSVAALQIPTGAVREMLEFQKDFDSGKLEGAEKHLQKAIKIFPKWALAHHNLGQVLAKMHQYDKAIPEFEAARDLDPQMVQPSVSLAGIYLLQKEFPKGEAAARRALEIDPSNSAAQYFLGRVLEMSGQETPEAIDLLRKTQAQYPAAHLVLSNIFLKRNQPDDAKVELKAYLAQPNAMDKEKVQCILQHLSEPAAATCAMQ